MTSSTSAEEFISTAAARRAPYPGLRPFRQEDAYCFFGRREQTSRMLERLEETRFLAVVGASGCGKSSLVYAGLLPALEQGWLNGALPNWKIATLRPGEAPLKNLAVALYQSLHGGGESAGPEGADPFGIPLLQNTLEQGRQGLVQAVADADLDGRTNVLVFVDQFEELFRYRERAEQELRNSGKVQTQYDRQNESIAFVNLLLTAARQQATPQRQPIYVLLSMRSDFLGDCDVFQGLPEAISDSQFLTPRMTREQLREAIVEPLKLFNARAEPALVDRILNEVGTQQDLLPLMQHALMRTWNIACTPADEWRSRTIVLGEQHYLSEQVAGVEWALDHHADDVYLSLSNHRSPARAAGDPAPLRHPTLARLLDGCLRLFGSSTEGFARACATQLAGTSPPGPSPAADVAAAPRRATPPSRFIATLSRICLHLLNLTHATLEPPPSRRQWLCERLFRSLSESNSSGQLIRRLAKIRQIAAEAEPSVDQRDPQSARQALAATVSELIEVVRPFLAPDCSLLVASPPESAAAPLSGETTLDVSHEALLRQWRRCHKWTAAELRSARVWRRVVEQTALAKIGKAGYFSRADLAPIEQWLKVQRPTAAWSLRYGTAAAAPVELSETQTFLRRSRRWAEATRGALIVAPLAAAAVVGWSLWQQRQDERERIVDAKLTKLLSLPESEASQIHELLKDLQRLPVDWRTRLQSRLPESVEELSSTPAGKRKPEARNAALAFLDLAADEESPPPAIPLHCTIDEILHSRPEQIVALRIFLAPFATEASTELWRSVEQTTDRLKRLRAAAALAGLPMADVPSDENRRLWERYGDEVARELLALPALDLRRDLTAWKQSLEPRREFLLPELSRTYEDRPTADVQDLRRSQREAAAMVLADFWSQDYARLVHWLTLADDAAEFQPFALALAADRAKVINLVRRAAGTVQFAQTELAVADESNDWKNQWRGPLNAAVWLAQIDDFAAIESLLAPARRSIEVEVEVDGRLERRSESLVDPTFQSFLIARFHELGAVDPQRILAEVDRLASEKAKTADREGLRQALLLILGDYDSALQSRVDREQRLARLGELSRRSTDAGVRAAAQWVSRQWRGQRRATADGTPPVDDLRPPAAADWFVNSRRQVFSVLRRPPDIVKEEKVEGRRILRFHGDVIDYDFAVGCTEVTVAEFGMFLADQSVPRFLSESTCAALQAQLAQRPPGHPAGGVPWYAAAAYCNWLSRADGVPEDQWYYAPNPDGAYAAGMAIRGDVSELDGYRLPTVDEWVYACSGGATTQFSFGDVEEPRVISRYAWWRDNSHGATPRAVAVLRPNRFGLFDCHGNLFEWTDTPVDVGSQEKPTEDDDLIDDRTVLAVMGGWYRTTDPSGLGNSIGEGRLPTGAKRQDPLKTNDLSAIGFRPARTYRPK